MPKPARKPEAQPQMVWCVICVTPGQHGSEVTHIFSSLEKAEAFANAETRVCVIYDYVVDVPELMEGVMQ